MKPLLSNAGSIVALAFVWNTRRGAGPKGACRHPDIGHAGNLPVIRLGAAWLADGMGHHKHPLESDGLVAIIVGEGDIGCPVR